MKFKDIEFDEKKSLQSVLKYIKSIDFTNYITSDGEQLLYNEDDFYVEDVLLGKKNVMENINTKIQNILLTYWKKLIDNIPVQKHDKEYIIVIEPVIKGKEEGEWKLSAEDFKNGDFYMNISTKILENLDK